MRLIRCAAWAGMPGHGRALTKGAPKVLKPESRRHQRARVGLLLGVARRPGPSAIPVAARLLAVGGGSVPACCPPATAATSRPRVAPARDLPVPLGTVLGTPPPVPVKTGRCPPPVELTIPAIGVRTSLIRLGLAPSGALQVPASAPLSRAGTPAAGPGAVGRR